MFSKILTEIKTYKKSFINIKLFILSMIAAFGIGIGGYFLHKENTLLFIFAIMYLIFIFLFYFFAKYFPTTKEQRNITNKGTLFFACFYAVSFIWILFYPKLSNFFFQNLTTTLISIFIICIFSLRSFLLFDYYSLIKPYKNFIILSFIYIFIYFCCVFSLHHDYFYAYLRTSTGLGVIYPQIFEKAFTLLAVMCCLLNILLFLCLFCPKNKNKKEISKLEECILFTIFYGTIWAAPLWYTSWQEQNILYEYMKNL